MTQPRRHTRRRTLALLASGVVGTATVGAAQQEQDGDGQPADMFRLGGRIRGWQGRQPQAIQGQSNPTLTVREGQLYELTWENLDGAPHNFAFRNDQGENLPVILPATATPPGGEQTENGTANQTVTQADNETETETEGEVIRILPGESPLEDPEIGGPRVNQTQANQTAQATPTATRTPAGNQTVTTTGNGTTEDGVSVPEGAISKTETVSEEGATQTFRFVATSEITTYICPIHPTTMVGDVQVEAE